ncbi:retroviral-like aspartic protease family protein [Candidatus Amesbacteria bacterium]|nr:retroviral-like aspartic protease family protein [Candidatus Amesbacteria bacterium]
MGVTFADLSLKNIDLPAKRADGKFLVDSGATFTVVPAEISKQLQLKPLRKEKFELADGGEIIRSIGNCKVKYKDIEVITQVILGEGDDSALLGVLTLEEMGLTLHPLSRKLDKMILRM